MRRGSSCLRIAAPALRLSLCLLLGACASIEPVRRGASRVGAGVGDAVTAPLEDLNVKRVQIPPVLVRARSDPYTLAGLTACEPIAAEIGRLDEALGPDMDEPPPPPGTRADRAADFTADQTLNAIKDTATDIIPFRGWVRRLSGAERHRKDVQDAIRAGAMRRSYLKGVGMRMNCGSPAAPSWFTPEVKTARAAQPPRASKSRPPRRRR